jgi:hypothetical protein
MESETLGDLAWSGMQREHYLSGPIGKPKKKARKTNLTGLVLAAQNIPHHKLPKILMGKQIKHLVSSSSF